MPNQTMKAASRHVLLAEFILGTFLVAWGAGKGADAKTLIAVISHSVSEGWFLAVLIGAAQVCAAAIEWCNGLKWPPRRLQRHVAARGWIAGFAAVMWAYELKEFIFDPVVLSAIVLMLVAPVCIGINLYSMFCNRKVFIALDPDVPTSHLDFER